MQNHPLHGLASRAVVGLGSKQWIVVGFEVGVVEHRCFNDGQGVPCVSLKEVFRLNFVEDPNEVDVGTVFALDFVKQINAGIVGKEPVFAVVKVEVHAA